MIDARTKRRITQQHMDAMARDAGKEHERKCWDCGNIAVHQDNIVPEVNCKKCGSQDTRRLKTK
jgi:ribosomal protein S27E